MHPNEVIHHIRITLTGTKVSSLESVCNDLVNGAKQQKMKVKVGAFNWSFTKFQRILEIIINNIFKGPTRMPNKVLYVNTRRTPCGQGSKTWDRFQVIIFYSKALKIYENPMFLARWGFTSGSLMSGLLLRLWRRSRPFAWRQTLWLKLPFSKNY